jgi:hypothetical protein
MVRAQLWMPTGAAVLAVGAGFMIAVGSTQHAKDWTVWTDPLFLSGIGFMLLALYIFLAVFAFPWLWLPSVKQAEHPPFLRVMYDNVEGANLNDGTAVTNLRIGVENQRRQDVSNVTLQLLAPVRTIVNTNPRWLESGLGRIEDYPDERLEVPSGELHGSVGWDHRPFDLGGKLTTQIHFRVFSAGPGTHQMRLKIVSADLETPLVTDFFVALGDATEVSE